MQSLIDFLKKYDFVIVFILLEVAAIVGISLNSRYQRSKIVGWANSVAGSWYDGINSVSDYFGLRTENERLAKENAELRASLEASFISYNEDEFVYNDTTYKRRYNYREARVIKNAWSMQNNLVMINKGSAQGVRTDMAVISPQGIVGVVIGTTKNFSAIMPVLHSKSRNSVMIKRTGNKGSLVWNGNDYRYATVVDIPSTHKLYKSDTIITSGLANDFPEGILVGYVRKIKNLKGSGFCEVTIELATDFSRLDHVYIIDNIFKEEQDELVETVNKELQIENDK